MDKPDTNLRRLKLIDGLYTMESVSARSRSVDLCDFCGALSSCPIRADLARHNSVHGVGVSVRECPIFMPTLTFRRPLLGLEGHFNTFRLGAAAHARMKIDGVVSLRDAATSEEIGRAVVERLYIGDLDNMLNGHAKNNHMLLTEKHEDPANTLRNILNKSYGPMLVREAKQVSVIYLRRDDNAGGSQTG